MIINTAFGNFGSFKDLQKFMTLENKNDVFIKFANYWGINCIISTSGTNFTKSEIDEIVG